MNEPLALSFPPELIEAIAQRVAELMQASQAEDTHRESPWLDVEGVCAYTRMSRNQLYKLTAAAAIPVRKKVNGQGLFFHRDELDDWLTTTYPRLDRLP